MRFSPDV